MACSPFQCEDTIKYHPGKLNSTADYLSRTVNAINFSSTETTIESDLLQRIKIKQKNSPQLDRPYKIN